MLKGYENIELVISEENDEIELNVYRYKDKNRIKVDFKRLSPDERKAIVREYYKLFVVGSKKFAEISTF